MFDQQAATQPVDGRDISAVHRQGCTQIAIGDQRGSDALAQLACRRFGEGDGKDALGPHQPIAHPLGEGGLDMVGLAGAGTSGNDRKLSHWQCPQGQQKVRHRRA